MTPTGEEKVPTPLEIKSFTSHFEVGSQIDPKSESFEATITNIEALLTSVESVLVKNSLSVDPEGKVQITAAEESKLANPFYDPKSRVSIYKQLKELPTQSAIYGIVKSALIIPSTHPIWSNPELIETLITTCVIGEAFFIDKFAPKSVVSLFALYANSIAPKESYKFSKHLAFETPIKNNLLKMIFFMNPQIVTPMMGIAKVLDLAQKERINTKKRESREAVLGRFLDTLMSQLPIAFDRANWPLGAENSGRDIFTRSLSEFFAIIIKAENQRSTDPFTRRNLGQNQPEYLASLYEQIDQLYAELAVLSISYEDFTELLQKATN